MFRKSLTILAATLSLAAPVASYAQQASAPRAAQQAQPAPARGGMDAASLLLPLALVVIVVGALAHKH
ncbi:hypothetical protein [Loktanella salsilacus]|uniref:hypothetical protein n=1 Tax=Loktanella salsilacus TaxID=195913 RepID=UPI0020B63A42|nr:hypothetical protein [Loktanella salsilacus]UTH43396.1 hypothetical protein KBK07_09620 [Loktanella salsilacus]